MEEARRRFGGRQAAWVWATVVALAAIGCEDDADRRASRELVQTFTISCSSLASGQIGPGQSVSTLATAERTGTSEGWTTYVELSNGADIVCNYNLPGGVAAGTITSLSLDVNYMGPTQAEQLWTFQVRDTTTGSWVSLGNNSFAPDWVWTKHTFTFPAPLARYFSSAGLLQIRYGSDSNAGDSDLDQMLIRGTADTGTTGTGGSAGGAGTTGRGGTTGAAGRGGTTGAAGRGGTTGAAGTIAAGGRGGTTGAAGTTAAGGRGGTTGAAGTTGAGGRIAFSMSCSSLASGQIGPGQSVSTLATAERTGTSEGWTTYVELTNGTHIVCNYNLPGGIAAGTITSLSLDVNYMGPTQTEQLWTFQVLDVTTGSWVSLGNNSFAPDWVWTKHTFTFPAPLARYFSSGGLLQIRYGSDGAGASDLDQMLITATAGGSGGSVGSGGSGAGGAGGRGGAGGSSGFAGICGSTSAPPLTYQHVVVFSFENRTWSDVGLGFSSMPYLRSLASQCSFFSDYIETNPQQSSLTQYIGMISGVNNPNTVDDCNPSSTCRSTDDNLFRQVRRAGGTARNYVEDAPTSCSDENNASTHIPALYFYGTYTDATGTHNDHDFCNTEVRPYAEFDPNNLPTFAWITPNLCNDGHDCANSVVDSWASTNIQRVLDSAAYRAGTVAVFVWYDEDYPVPNAQIAPTSRRGNITQPGVASHAALLKTIEDMLGLPPLNQGQVPAATNLRSILGI